MDIIVCGMNHNTAPIALREKVAFPQEKLSYYLNELQVQENIKEAVILSTCNRTDIYCVEKDVNKLINWFCNQHPLSCAEIQSHLYIYRGKQAIEHIMQVACGLDSMVLGEPQILGQLKSAYSESCISGAAGTLFTRLFQHIFAVAKEVRTNTAIGACPVSVASAAVKLVKQKSLDLEGSAILTLGSGDTIELVLQHLEKCVFRKLFISGRNAESVMRLASEYGGEALCYTQIEKNLLNADIVISATASALPIIEKAMVERVLKSHPQKKILFVDLAVPRDIDPEVNSLAGMHTYCIDDLKDIIQQNRLGREHAAEQAKAMIQVKCEEFLAWQASLDLVGQTIRAYRGQIEEICFAELAHATRALNRGADPLQVLHTFAHDFTNKLLHSPSVQLRQAGAEGRLDLLQLAQELFALPLARV
jgi:glutamyl-tRNA reductase